MCHSQGHHAAWGLSISALADIDMIAETVKRNGWRRCSSSEPHRGSAKSALEQHRWHTWSIQGVLCRVRNGLAEARMGICLIQWSCLKALVVHYVDGVVCVPTTILCLGLIRCTSPLVIHDELVLMHSPGNVLHNHKLVARAHHWNGLLPAFERCCQGHMLPSMGPREHDWHLVLSNFLCSRSAVLRWSSRRSGTWHGPHQVSRREWPSSGCSQSGLLSCLRIAHAGQTPECANPKPLPWCFSRPAEPAGWQLQGCGAVS
mmetsp:Transcript_66047/g.157941  ORF Transcript_66047/g.157941 Transcript_66047/m.157941 type:complete len:260 (+) Transcript_66047:198-977(+)